MRPIVSRRDVKIYVVATGIAAGLAQVVLFRELMVVATGTELVIGLLLAVWLLAAAAGSAWADRGANNPVAGAARAWKLAWLAAGALGVGVLIIRAARPVLSTVPNAIAAALPAHSKLAYLFGRLIAVQPGEALGLFHVIAVGAAATALPAFCCGAQFVTAARLMGRRGAAGAYALDAIGHLVGGVALAFAATVWLDGMAVAAVVSFIALAAGALVLPAQRSRISRAAGAGAAAMAAVWLVLMGPSQSWRSPLAKVVEERAGLLGLFTVAEQKGEGVYFFVNGAPVGASPPTPHAEVLVGMALVQVGAPERVLLIGGGGSGGLAECLKHSPKHVDYVDFDPVFLELQRKWCSEADRRAFDDPRTRAIARDPRLFLRQAGEQYDAIIMNLPAPTTALMNRLYTRQWFELCRRRLRPGGVVAFALPYSQVYRTASLAMFDRSIVGAAMAGLGAAADNVALLAGDELVVAVRVGAPAVARPEEITARLAERGVDVPYLQAFVWDWADEYNVAQAWEMLQGPTVANEDWRPAGYLLGTAYWLEQMTPTVGQRLSKALGRWSARGTFVLLLGSAAAAIAAMVLAIAPGQQRRAAVVFMTAAGFGAMAAEMAILFWLQTAHGYVYGWVGVVTGAFMLGLALGVAALGRGAAARAAKGALGAAAAVAVGGGAMAMVAAGPLPLAAFAALSVLAGAYAGVAFAVALNVAGEGGRRAKVGGVYAADLLGGVAGAVMVPPLLIPLAGLAAAAGVPLLAAAAPLIVLLWRR